LVDSKIDQEEELLSERKRGKGIEVDLTISAAVVVVVVAAAAAAAVVVGQWAIDNSVLITYFVVVPVLGDIHRGLVGMIVVAAIEVVGVGVVVVVDTAEEEVDAEQGDFCIVVAGAVVVEEEAVEVVVVVAIAEQEVPSVLVLEAKDPYTQH
jgi:hypothetical protein